MAYAAYISETDYKDTYHGKTIASDDFARIAFRASDELDRLTFNRVRRNGLVSYDETIQELIILATCSIAESISLFEDATDSTGVITVSESIGGAHSTSIDKSSVDKIKTDGITRAKQYLMSTGLISAVMGR